MLRWRRTGSLEPGTKMIRGGRSALGLDCGRFVSSGELGRDLRDQALRSAPSAHAPLQPPAGSERIGGGCLNHPGLTKQGSGNHSSREEHAQDDEFQAEEQDGDEHQHHGHDGGESEELLSEIKAPKIRPHGAEVLQ